MPAWFEELAERLATRPIVRLQQAAGLRPAAVLVPLHVQAGEIWVVLIRRSDGSPQQQGQPVFPGAERADGDEDEVATALRGAHDEIGVRPGAVMVLGHLDEVSTPAGIAVAPVVGAIPSSVDLQKHGDGVAAVVRVPLLYLARPELVEEQEEVHGPLRVRSPILHYRGHRVWGETARILADLLSRLDLAPS